MRVLPAIFALLTTAALVPAPPAVAAPSGGPATDTITLITGDRVALRPGGGVTIEGGHGRDHMGFATTREDGHTFVVPDDAQARIVGGRLDKRLFDVTALSEFGYRDRTPVLVQNGRSFSPSGEGATALRTAKANTKIWLDGKRKLSLDRSVPQIGAPDAWAAGYTGAGVTVAVLDSGIDATHPDLAGRIAEERNFTESADTDDTAGHGTHVASTIAGVDAEYRGVAPDARLLIGKVCEETYCSDSAVLAGIEWAAGRGAKIVNLSLGGGDSPGADPLEQAIDRFSAEKGMLFVVAAGNSGPRERTLGSPGTADAALTVGAVDRDDRIASFSSRGPRTDGGMIKPEITAPGTDIVAAKARNGILGTPVEPGYVSMSGTSMATPHVTGAAALLAQEHPDWTGARLKAALMGSAKPTAGAGTLAQGAGRVDLIHAIASPVTAEPVSLSFGTQTWPHDDDKPIERLITYTNGGADPLTLGLTVDSAAPSGVFRATPSRVTVAPGGTATVVVEADTSNLDGYGRFDGTLIARSGEVAVRTPVEVVSEAEAVDLTITARDSTGTPGSFSMYLYRTDRIADLLEVATGDDGVGKFRVEPGSYGILARISNRDEQTFMSYPNLTMDGPKSVDLDAADASTFDIRPVGDDGVTEKFGGFKLDHTTTAGYGFQFLYSVLGGFGNAGRPMRFGQTGPTPPAGDVKFSVEDIWATDPGTADARVYNLGWDDPLRSKDGLTRRVEPESLAVTDYRVPVLPAGDELVTQPWLWPVGRDLGAAYAPAIYVTGATRIRNFTSTVQDGVRWEFWFRQSIGSYEPRRIAYTAITGYRPGTARQSSLWFPVRGPSLTWVADGNDLTRRGDLLRAPTVLFGDAAGHRIFEADATTKTALSRLDKPGNIEPDRYGDFPVPAEPGRYRLTQASERIEASWDFASERTDGMEPLPVSVPRFQPDLDAVRPGPFVIPVTVQSYEGSGAGRPEKITAEVSFDDGATWTEVPVAGGRMLVDHPAGPGYVSLRGSVTDEHGNTGTVQIIRAYQLNG